MKKLIKKPCGCLWNYHIYIDCRNCEKLGILRQSVMGWLTRYLCVVFFLYNLYKFAQNYRRTCNFCDSYSIFTPFVILRVIFTDDPRAFYLTRAVSLFCSFTLQLLYSHCILIANKKKQNVTFLSIVMAIVRFGENFMNF